MHFWGGNAASNEDLMAKYLTTSSLQPIRSVGGSTSHVEPHSPSERTALGRVRQADKNVSTRPAGSESNGLGPTGREAQRFEGRDFIQTYNPFAV